MTYRISRAKAVSTRETRAAERIAKILNEDMGLNLEAVGYHMVRNHPPIVWHRLEVLSLTAGEEYDRMIDEMNGVTHGSKFLR
jgi:hypothetical protein